MNKNQEVVVSQYFGTESERRAAAVAVGEKIMKVLFFYFEEDQEELDDEGAMDEFSNYLWDVTSSALAAAGISFIGKDDDVFFEDVVETNDGPSFFEGHDDRFVADN